MVCDIFLTTINPNYCLLYRQYMSSEICDLIDNGEFNRFIGLYDSNISNNVFHICNITYRDNLNEALNRIRDHIDPGHEYTFLQDDKLFIASNKIGDAEITSTVDNKHSMYSNPVLMPLRQKIYPKNCINKTKFINTTLYNDEYSFSVELNYDTYRDMYKNILKDL